MPMHLHTLFTARRVGTAALAAAVRLHQGHAGDADRCAEGCPAHPDPRRRDFEDVGTKLFDLEADPAQNRPLDDPARSRAWNGIVADILADHDAPLEIYDRMKLAEPGASRTIGCRRRCDGPGAGRPAAHSERRLPRPRRPDYPAQMAHPPARLRRAALLGWRIFAPASRLAASLEIDRCGSSATVPGSAFMTTLSTMETTGKGPVPRRFRRRIK